MTALLEYFKNFNSRMIFANEIYFITKILRYFGFLCAWATSKIPNFNHEVGVVYLFNKH